MTKNESIRKFVRNTLGCKCPDNVFAQIDDKQVTSKISPHTRSITIGGKLLLYVWEVNSPDQLQEGIPAILASGKKARNEIGLNRFRAILVTEDPSTIKIQADFCLSQFMDIDDKMHLHVVSSKGFTGI
jgi:hypothetical protein